MQVNVALSRAASALGKNVRYSSPGQTPPLSASSWPTGPTKIDCSGFVAWCLRVSRKVDHPLYDKVNGGWFETTGIHADGLSSTGFFQQIDKPVPGSILVYPDYKGKDGKTHDGHMGIVTDTNGSKGIAGVTGIIHCSVSNDQKGSAIQLTGADIWKAKSTSIIVWWEGFTPT